MTDKNARIHPHPSPLPSRERGKYAELQVSPDLETEREFIQKLKAVMD